VTQAAAELNREAAASQEDAERQPLTQKSMNKVRDPVRAFARMVGLTMLSCSYAG